MQGTVLAPAFNGVKTGLEGVATASDATPDAIARLFQAGIYTEAALRGGAQLITESVARSISSVMRMVQREPRSDKTSTENDDKKS